MPRARLAAALLAPLLLAARADAAPPVPWTAAREHVRRLVTIEGVVARATLAADRRCVLEFDPNDPAALRIVVIIPFVTDLPADPSHLYQGKRVQVTGRVLRFQDRLEMLVTPPQLEVVGLTAVPPTPASAVAAAPPTAERTPAAPAPAGAPPASNPPPARVAATDPRCRAWRDERTAIRDELRTLVGQLGGCLAADRPGCAGLGDQLGPPLSRLAAVEARLDRHCP
jgi:hypothetical protein